PPEGSPETAEPKGYNTLNDVRIGSMIHTVERGPISAFWSKGGEDTTAGGHQVLWGHFYANPDDVNWGSENNPDLFVKIWFDATGRIDVNFFHVSVPDIEVCSDFPQDNIYDKKGTTILDNRYIRHEFYKSDPETTEVTLKWDPVAEMDFDRYVLYWGSDSRHYAFNSLDNSEDVVKIAPASYTVRNLTRNQTYYFAVKAAYKGGQFSDYSNEAAIPSIHSPQDGFYVDESNHTAYTISGTAAEQADVEIFADNILLTATTASASGNGAVWSADVDFTLINGGIVHLTARSTGAVSGRITGTYRF
ncbi:fibronectin type III domain-containing protein, partial [Desulfobacterales bacterium HSG2]|nr:fibronectin type III domain-containing protein [Desulfobacterales bacterium HSG2]